MSNNAAVALFSQFGDFDPMLMAPDQSSRVTACLRALGDTAAKVPMLAQADPPDMASEDFWPDPDHPDAYYRPYIVKDGILMIPVKGVLLHGFTYAVGNYATGYQYIEQALKRGLSDPTVAGIALICDSPGGHVAGCFELGDKIFAARTRKSIQAFVYEHAFSAAYALASAADKITMSRTGGVGSVGVVTMHVSFEKALEKEGIQVTFVYAGKHKIDGNPYQALSADAKVRIQRRIDELYAVFTSAVARNRSIPEIDVHRQEALTFTATEAVDRLMADKIGPMDEALAVFSASLNGSGGYYMSTQANGAKAFTQADIDAAVQAEKDKAAAATKAATEAAAKAGAEAKARIVAIKGLDEAKTRPAAAEACAMTTEMTVDQAKAFLAALPEEKKAEAKKDDTTNNGNSAFEKAMEGAAPGPGAGKGAEGDKTQEQKDQERTKSILGARFGAADTAAAKH